MISDTVMFFLLFGLFHPLMAMIQDRDGMTMLVMSWDDSIARIHSLSFYTLSSTLEATWGHQRLIV